MTAVASALMRGLYLFLNVDETQMQLKYKLYIVRIWPHIAFFYDKD